MYGSGHFRPACKKTAQHVKLLISYRITAHKPLPGNPSLLSLSHSLSSMKVVLCCSHARVIQTLKQPHTVGLNVSCSPNVA